MADHQGGFLEDFVALEDTFLGGGDGRGLGRRRLFGDAVG